jgi:hypothetical protein
MTRHGAAAVVLAASVAALCGCGTSSASSGGSGDRVQAVPEEGVVDPYGDPVVYPEDPFEGFPVVNELTYPGVSEPDAAEPPAAGQWAVQVSACAAEDDAVRLAGIASAATGLVSRIDFEGAWWKVRLGSYDSREQAGEGLDIARSHGYSDAWIVEVLP